MEDDNQVRQAASIKAGCFAVVKVPLGPLAYVMSLGLRTSQPFSLSALPTSTNNKFYQQPRIPVHTCSSRYSSKGCLLPKTNSHASYYEDHFFLL